MIANIVLHPVPRVVWTWAEFEANTPRKSIALDGMVSGGPRFSPETVHVNFDHHDGVIREATMSSCKQVYFAIKGGLMETFGPTTEEPLHIYFNDTDQDTSFAIDLIVNYKLYEGAASLPNINRLLDITDKWDITAGAFPMNLDDKLVRQHAWVFEHYSRLRKSGQLASATAEVLYDNLLATLARLQEYRMGNAGETKLDDRHKILYDCPNFKIVDEIGGNEARYLLFAKGINAYISLVAQRKDGRFVWTVGRRSRYIPFPLPLLYAAYNEAEGFGPGRGFNGSDIVGGSDRLDGSGLNWEQMRDITLDVLRRAQIVKS